MGAARPRRGRALPWRATRRGARVASGRRRGAQRSRAGVPRGEPGGGAERDRSGTSAEQAPAGARGRAWGGRRSRRRQRARRTRPARRGCAPGGHRDIERTRERDAVTARRTPGSAAAAQPRGASPRTRSKVTECCPCRGASEPGTASVPARARRRGSWAVAFAPDGDMIASAGEDRRLRLGDFGEVRELLGGARLEHGQEINAPWPSVPQAMLLASGKRGRPPSVLAESDAPGGRFDVPGARDGR